MYINHTLRVSCGLLLGYSGFNGAQRGQCSLLSHAMQLLYTHTLRIRGQKRQVALLVPRQHSHLKANVMIIYFQRDNQVYTDDVSKQLGEKKQRSSTKFWEYFIY